VGHRRDLAVTSVYMGCSSVSGAARGRFSGALMRGIMSETAAGQSFLRITAEIVSAYVYRNQVSPRELQRLIESVYTEVARDTDVAAATPNLRFDPAAAAVRSVFQDHIVCFEDGRKLKMLKRHLEVC
jgi:predicted transcriptional regulator